MIATRIADPEVIERASYWWERCLVRILRSGRPHATQLRDLVGPGASETRLGDLVYPST